MRGVGQAMALYSKLSEERKRLQEEGLCPEWYTTGGWQLFKEKYLYQADNPKEQYMRIAHTLAAHTPDPGEWRVKFYELLWKGWLSPSTPVLANIGTTRGFLLAVLVAIYQIVSMISIQLSVR